MWSRAEDSRSGLPSEIERLWIELDLPATRQVGRSEQGDLLPPPIFCAEVPAEGADLPAILGWLRGRKLSLLQAGLVESWQRSFPPEARVLYAFHLGSRPRSPMRLEWVGVPMAEAGETLRAVIPPGMRSTVAKGAGLMDGVERPHLSYDIDFASDSVAKVLPRVGLEGSFKSPPEKDSRWRELLDRWVGEGLCDPAKAAACLDYSGVDSYWTVREEWPSRQVGLGGHAVRRLSHLKLVVSPNGDLEAKAYLLFQYLPSTGSASAKF